MSKWEGAISNISGWPLKINRQVHIPWQQYLINWKWCQHTSIKGMDCNQEIIDHMENWSDEIRQDFFQTVVESILQHYIYTNKTHRKLHLNAMCCFDQIIEVTYHKTAAIWPFIIHLKNHLSKMKKRCWTQLERRGWFYRQHLFIDPNTWIW